MVQEDENQMCSNNSSSIGGCGSRSTSSSKKLKQKKVPQRGLGVAQLEKIRIEEQQKKGSSNTTNISSPTHSPSLPTAPFPNYSHNKQSKSSIPFRPLSPSSNPIFRSCSIPDIENFHLGSVPPLNNPSNGGGFDVGWPLIPTNCNVNVTFPMFWNPYEFSHDRKEENSRLDNQGLTSLPSLSLPYESCPIGPLPDLLTRGQQYQQTSSLVNISSMNHSSSSVLSFPVEPPSNQSYRSSYSPLWPDEEKMMVGMKRPCLFPFDNPTIPTFNFDPAIPIYSAMPEPINSKKRNRSEKGNSNGEFLTLATPAITPIFSRSRLKQSSTFLSSYNGDFLSFESLPYQGSIEDVVMNSGQGEPSQQPNNFFNFFQSKKVQVPATSSPTSHNSCSGEVEESIDLNLRL